MAKNILVITMPNCSKCEDVKSWLKNANIPFESKMLDSELQTDLVMENIYYNPPVIKVGEKYFSYKDFQTKPLEIFRDDSI